MSADVPLSYIRHHGSAIYQMFGKGILSAIPLTRPDQVDTPTPVVREKVKALPEKLVTDYIRWSGASAERYSGVLPAHLFCCWAMPLIAKLTAKAPYNLLTVLNQGALLQSHQLIPVGEDIFLEGCLKDVANDGRRIRIETQLSAKTKSVPHAQDLNVMAAVPVGKRVKNSGGDSKRKDVTFETIGTWSAARNEGVNFALLTGDFNPIHTSWLLARRTRYNGCILHGAGFLARTFETIQNTGVTIQSIDYRYLKPLKLPANELQVQISKDADEDGRMAFQLQSPDGSLHLAGKFSL